MSLKERDKKYLWHPLTQHQLYPDTLGISGAQGCLLYDESGKEYIDGIASWYTCMYGHCNPYIVERVSKQLKELDQVVFAGFTHRPAVELSEALIEILPKNQQKLFFSDNGSTAVDVAIKMALQYHFNRGEKRSKIIALENGFHGDTFGAMSVSGLSVYNGPFEDFFIDVVRISVPTETNFEEVYQQFTDLLENHEVAAFVYEPLVQGAAAMHMYDSDHLDRLLKVAKDHGVLCIADEVMTGFGKTGQNFASDYMQHKPDIICLSKSLTAGVVPMAITSCTQGVYDAFLSNELSKGFFHGHTYSANPMACTAALAGIELLCSDEIHTNIKEINRAHAAFDQRIKRHPKVDQTRLLGVIYAIDLNIETDRYGSFRDQLFDFFMERGVFLRPLGRTIYILPPFTIRPEQLDQIYNCIEKALDSF